MAWRSVAIPVGLSAIAGSAFLFSSTTPFPGYAALLPVLGSGLVILGAGTADRFGAGRVLSKQPFQFIGDISYSLYLWHWPLIVFYKANVPGPMQPAAAVCILAVTIILSWLTKRFVEDRYRERSVVSGPDRITARPLYPILASFLAPLLIAGGALAVLSRNTITVPEGATYPGAEILLTNDRLPKVANYAPPLTQVKRDTANQFQANCERLDTPGSPCRYGPTNGVATVFLIGDSHAQQWVPALAQIAEERRWTLLTFTKGGCPLVSVLVQKNKKPYHDCLTWGRDVLAAIDKQRPDLVILTHSYKHEVYEEPENTEAIMQDAILRMFHQISAKGIQVAAIADSPVWAHDPASCLQDAANCVMPLSAYRDPIVVAAQLDPSVALIEVNDYLCPGGRCPAVIGNVIVWRDRHHVTATFARTMARPLAMLLDKAISKISSKLVGQDNAR